MEIRVKSYLHITDFVNAVILAFDGFLHEEKGVEVYNFGSFDQVDVKRIAEIVAEEMGLQNVEFKLTVELMVAAGGRET